MVGEHSSIELAKLSAQLHFEEAALWVKSDPVQWAHFQQLQKAICLETLEHASITAEEKTIIANLWPLFRMDETLLRVRQAAAIMATDAETRAGVRRAGDSIMEDSE